MMRLISILLVIAGLAAAGLGGAALMERYFPKDEPLATVAPPPPPPPAPAQSDIPMDPPPPEPEAEAESEASVESAPVMDDEFNFQPMVEEAPADAAPMARAMRAEPSAGEEAAAPAPPEAVDIDDPNVTAAVSDSFIDTLKTVPVAHETPASAEYKRAFDVTFAIDATGGESAADALPGRGVIEEGTARVSDRVEVRLSGAAFTIVPASPPVQSLSPLTENTWRWSVTALSAGDHDLTFEIFAVDANEVVPLRTYRDTVTVKVSGLNRAIAFADQANPLFVLLGGLGSILAGVIGVARFVLKK
ncbi:MAG: hypothetical protein C0456_14905 [Hyphomonas sp.]|uniref:hypothetical protein n=1 Tax=Hyphomonas sp. TaxID=87 RepID=UPI001DAA0B2D|nr:hypothetical protein [Hyphomonas sp.]MBA4227909.1 hypothetical protein [Hyphomonas sp.]